VPSPLYVDFSDARPAPAAIRAAGYSGVIRYGSHDPAKDLSAPEYAGYRAVGLDVLGVWETTGVDALAGASAGASDAAEAEAFFGALGYPTDPAHPIFYAIDFGATAQQDVPVEEYFAAIRAYARNHGWGPYGSLSVCAAVAAVVPGAVGYWQTVAWSAGHIWSQANLYQRLAPTLPRIAGTGPGSYDENVLLLPFAGAPVPPPPPPTVYPGGNVNIIKTPVSVTISGGNGWNPSPVPAGEVFNAVFNDENPEVVNRYDKLPTFVGKATQPGPHSPNGSLNWDGPDGTFGAEVWSVDPAGS
jgi:hypothetical protein